MVFVAESIMALCGFISPILAYMGISASFLMPLLKEFIQHQHAEFTYLLGKSFDLIQALKKGKSKLYDHYLSILLSILNKMAQTKKVLTKSKARSNQHRARVKKKQVGAIKKLVTALKKAVKVSKKGAKLLTGKPAKKGTLLLKKSKPTSISAKSIKKSSSKSNGKKYAQKAAFKEIAKAHYKEVSSAAKAMKAAH